MISAVKWLLALASLASIARTVPTHPLAARLDDIDLPAGVPAKIKITDKPVDPAGKLVKIRYGPFTLPPNSVFAALPEFAGGPKIHKPCDECFVGAFQGNLEYEDGSEANVDTGMYLHHFVIVNENKPDWLCGLRLDSLIRAQYVYNSGNERPPVRLNSKHKFGMRVDKQDKFTTAGEFMNMSNQTKTVYATVIYEVIPLNTPGYREATHLRVDVWQCGFSDVPARTGAYKYTSPKFVSPYSGVILHNDGHGHDGTTHVNLYINGKISCKSTQYYGLRPSATQPRGMAMQHGDGHGAEMQYISDAVSCEDYGRVEKGDVLWTEAFYNSTKYPQMTFKGHLENQMGISFLYIGRDEHTLKDKFPLDIRGPEFPSEMNITFWQQQPLNSTGPNLTTVLSAFGIPQTANLSLILGLPPGINVSNPYLDAPIPQPQFDLEDLNLSGLFPGLPEGMSILNITALVSDPRTGPWIDGMLATFIPGLPKGFKLSNIIFGGGIVTSEIDAIAHGILGDFFEAIGYHFATTNAKMDPITAISLASSVITFVDMATKIIAGTYEISRSATGTTVENAHIEAVIADLKEVATDLETDLPGKSKHERALKELASECQKSGDELLQLLNRIKIEGEHSTWKNFKATIISMRKQKEIASLEKRLGTYRSEILVQLTLMLQDQNSLVKVQLDKLENATLTMSSESALRTKALREDIIRDLTDLLTHQTTLNTIEGDSMDRLLSVERALEALSSMVTTVPMENAILKSLYFDSMNFRERTVIAAEDKTFQWLFEENEGGAELSHGSPSSQSTSAKSREDSTASERPELKWQEMEVRRRLNEEQERRARVRRLFTTWLSSGSGVFHISGKAGSGKSTLMKFLYHHKQTRAALKRWAGPKRLVFASFYFWKSQDQMQMSLEGLYRSILFTTLRQCPELIPTVFPTYWKQLNNRHVFITTNFISYFDVVKAFEVLTTPDTFPDHCFCYFVDGLDEYQGHTLDHVRLAKSLKNWASGDDFKICASSRPYVEYENLAPSTDQRLHLHELTSRDIYLFSRQMIEADDNFEQIKDSYLKLVTQVVRRSEGVFLWARLVINSLLVGMLRHDHFEALQKKLDVIPQDLNELYDQLLNSLDEDDRERAIKMMLLTIHRTSRLPLNSIVYWLLDSLGDPAALRSDGVKPPSWPSAEDMRNDVRLRIKSLTKGLLEITAMKPNLSSTFETHEVEFFHRTARDFVSEQLEPAQKTGKYDHIFDVEAYHRLLLAELTAYDVSDRSSHWNEVTIHDFFSRTVCRSNLPSDIMDGFNRVLSGSGDPASTDPFSIGSCKGILGRPHDWDRSNAGISFIHLAAYWGNLEYVLREVEKTPTLLTNEGNLSVLASALTGRQIELAKALIKRGSSPTQLISYGDADNWDVSWSIPIWLQAIQQDLQSRMHWLRIIPNYEMWEMLLGDDRVHADDCVFLLCARGEESPTHFTTLERVIEELKPANMAKLLNHAKRGKCSSYLSGAWKYLSRFSPVGLQPSLSSAAKMVEYIPYSIEDETKMTIKAVVCEGIQTKIGPMRVC